MDKKTKQKTSKRKMEKNKRKDKLEDSDKEEETCQPKKQTKKRKTVEKTIISEFKDNMEIGIEISLNSVPTTKRKRDPGNSEDKEETSEPKKRSRMSSEEKGKTIRVETKAQLKQGKDWESGDSKKNQNPEKEMESKEKTKSRYGLRRSTTIQGRAEAYSSYFRDEKKQSPKKEKKKEPVGKKHKTKGLQKQEKVKKVTGTASETSTKNQLLLMTSSQGTSGTPQSTKRADDQSTKKEIKPNETAAIDPEIVPHDNPINNHIAANDENQLLLMTSSPGTSGTPQSTNQVDDQNRKEEIKPNETAVIDPEIVPHDNPTNNHVAAIEERDIPTSQVIIVPEPTSNQNVTSEEDGIPSGSGASTSQGDLEQENALDLTVEEYYKSLLDCRVQALDFSTRNEFRAIEDGPTPQNNSEVEMPLDLTFVNNSDRFEPLDLSRVANYNATRNNQAYNQSENYAPILRAALERRTEPRTARNEEFDGNASTSQNTTNNLEDDQEESYLLSSESESENEIEPKLIYEYNSYEMDSLDIEIFLNYYRKKNKKKDQAEKEPEPKAGDNNSQEKEPLNTGTIPNEHLKDGTESNISSSTFRGLVNLDSKEKEAIPLADENNFQKIETLDIEKNPTNNLDDIKHHGTEFYGNISTLPEPVNLDRTENIPEPKTDQDDSLTKVIMDMEEILGDYLEHGKHQSTEFNNNVSKYPEPVNLDRTEPKTNINTSQNEELLDMEVILGDYLEYGKHDGTEFNNSVAPETLDKTEVETVPKSDKNDSQKDLLFIGTIPNNNPTDVEDHDIIFNSIFSTFPTPVNLDQTEEEIELKIKTIPDNYLEYGKHDGTEFNNSVAPVNLDKTEIETVPKSEKNDSQKELLYIGTIPNNNPTDVEDHDIIFDSIFSAFPAPVILHRIEEEIELKIETLPDNYLEYDKRDGTEFDSNVSASSAPINLYKLEAGKEPKTNKNDSQEMELLDIETIPDNRPTDGHHGTDFDNNFSTSPAPVNLYKTGKETEPKTGENDFQKIEPLVIDRMSIIQSKDGTYHCTEFDGYVLTSPASVNLDKTDNETEPKNDKNDSQKIEILDVDTFFNNLKVFANHVSKSDGTFSTSPVPVNLDKIEEETGPKNYHNSQEIEPLDIDRISDNILKDGMYHGTEFDGSFLPSPAPVNLDQNEREAEPNNSQGIEPMDIDRISNNLSKGGMYHSTEFDGNPSTSAAPVNIDKTKKEIEPETSENNAQEIGTLVIEPTPKNDPKDVEGHGTKSDTISAISSAPVNLDNTENETELPTDNNNSQEMELQTSRNISSLPQRPNNNTTTQNVKKKFISAYMTYVDKRNEEHNSKDKKFFVEKVYDDIPEIRDAIISRLSKAERLKRKKTPATFQQAYEQFLFQVFEIDNPETFKGGSSYIPNLAAKPDESSREEELEKKRRKIEFSNNFTTLEKKNVSYEMTFTQEELFLIHKYGTTKKVDNGPPKKVIKTYVRVKNNLTSNELQTVDEPKPSTSKEDSGDLEPEKVETFKNTTTTEEELLIHKSGTTKKVNNEPAKKVIKTYKRAKKNLTSNELQTVVEPKSSSPKEDLEPEKVETIKNITEEEETYSLSNKKEKCGRPELSTFEQGSLNQTNLEPKVIVQPTMIIFLTHERFLISKYGRNYPSCKGVYSLEHMAQMCQDFVKDAIKFEQGVSEIKFNDNLRPAEVILLDDNQLESFIAYYESIQQEPYWLTEVTLMPDNM